MFWRIKTLDAILSSVEGNALRRTLGPFQLMMLGVGTVIGTGIFVLISDAAQKAGPAMLISFVVAASVCGLAALCYAEMASMVPVSGSAYTYSYAVIGEHVAWLVGWALVLEYALAASAVAVGWSGYVVGLVESLLQHPLPSSFVRGPAEGGLVNLPAAFLTIVMSALLIVGTRESAWLNSVLVAVKLCALAMFIALTAPVMQVSNFRPFAPEGLGGVSTAAASIFFVYVGFDAVSTAAEETVNPQRNMPLGLIGSLLICTVFYVAVAAGAIGAVGGQPLRDSNAIPFETGSVALAQTCAAQAKEMLVCSKEALGFALRAIAHPRAAAVLALVAGCALPSVVLMTIYGQTRIFFAMSRDGLLPKVFSRLHPRFRTPHVVTMCTGIFVALFAGLFPVGKLADMSNAGTLFAFAVVALAVLILRWTEPQRHRPFRTPAVVLVATLAASGSLFLFISLGSETKMLFLGWTLVGMVVYGLYGVRHSLVGRGKSARPMPFHRNSPPRP